MDASAKALAFPKWSEKYRLIPNDFLRSALFSVTPSTKYIRCPIEANGDLVLWYEGKQLDQTHADVFMAILHDARNKPANQPFTTTKTRLLEILELKGDGGSNYAWITDKLLNLGSCMIWGLTSRKRIIPQGRIVEIKGIDLATGILEVTMNPIMLDLFEDATMIAFEERRALTGQLDKWLHGFISSHRPQVHEIFVETYKRICGSDVKHLWKFRQRLKQSLARLEKLGAIRSWKIDDTDKVIIERPVRKRTNPLRKLFAQQRRPAKPSERQRRQNEILSAVCNLLEAKQAPA